MGYRQRRNGQHELPAIARGGRLAQRVEIGAVEEVDPQHRQNEIVKRARGKVAGWMRRIVGRLPTEDRNVPLLQPGNHGIIEPCHRLVDRPWPKRGPPRPTPPAKEERVAGRHLHPGLPFPGLQILGKDTGSRREIRHTLELRNVIQDPPVTIPFFIVKIEFFAAPPSFVTSSDTG